VSSQAKSLAVWPLELDVSVDVSAHPRRTVEGGGGRTSLVVDWECDIRVSVVCAVVFDAVVLQALS
jgi:hypothetical protein